MLQKISDRLTDILLEKNIIKDENREIYVYGLLAMFSTVINFFLILFIGIIIGLTIETLIYLFSFALLRSYCGGYHSKTQLSCAIDFTIIYGLSMAVYCFLPVEYSMIFSMVAAGFCLILIFLLAPIEHKNRTFEGDEYIKFRFISRIIALSYFSIIYTISIFFIEYMMIATVLALVMLSVSFVLILALILYERSESE